MPVYSTTAVIIILFSTLALLFYMNKSRILGFRTLTSAAVSSLVACIAFPLIFSGLSGSGAFFATPGGAALAFLLAFIAYIVLILVSSAMIYSLITEKGERQISESLRNNGAVLFIKRILPVRKALEPAIQMEGENTAIQYIPIVEEPAETMESEVSQAFDTGYFHEKSVDTEQIIDKMGSENDVDKDQNIEMPDAESAVLVQAAGEDVLSCIEEAFRLKNDGDLEGSILYYMYALDRNPENELIFLIILDICAMYKSLGQIELARDILMSYSTHYGNQMDPSVRAEIEMNLVSA